MQECDKIDISEGIDINKKMYKNSVIFVITGTLKILVLNMNHIFAMSVKVLMQKAVSFNDAAIVSVKTSDCRIHFRYMRKDDAISINENKGMLHFFVIM